jgi:predicted O-methyltransferase YrrM
MHSKDQEYFSQFSAPVMELIHSDHYININATIPFFGPMLYFLVRALRCEKVLEIGTAEGYTSYYLANAIKDNAIRFGYNDSMFYGLDIVKTEFVKENLDKLNLPNTIITLDSINLTSETFKDIQFDLIFQDGAHDKEHILHELKVLWPQLKGNGRGYWIMHDTRGPGEEGYNKFLEYIKQEKIDVQHINLDDDVYGLGIFRKMEGFDYTKTFWVS